MHHPQNPDKQDDVDDDQNETLTNPQGNTLRRRRALMLTAAAAAAIAATAGCSDLVAGDSLVVQAAVADGAVANTTYGSVAENTVDGVTEHGFAGAAPCDYLRFAQGDLDQLHPKRVSFAFSGNAVTPCMQDKAGHPLTGSALALKYHDDLVTLTKKFNAAGASVIYSAPVCVSPNFTAGSNGSPLIRSMERQLATNFAAQHQHVAYSESAALSICPAWQYVAAYRSVDGLHLSPTGATIYTHALRNENKHTPIP